MIGIIVSSCTIDPNPPSAASPQAVCLELMDNLQLQCEIPYSNGVNAGLGSLQSTVTGDNTSPQFSQSLTFLPIDFPVFSSIKMNAATSSSGAQELTTPRTVRFDVPSSGGFRIKLYYIEYGDTYPSHTPNETGTTSSCYNNDYGTLEKKCYRWMRSKHYSSVMGELLCSNNTQFELTDRTIGSCQ